MNEAIIDVSVEGDRNAGQQQRRQEVEGMSDEPSPRPWRVADYTQCPGLADVFDASGSPSGLVAGELKPADAALIVAAVNERDRLRDIVRRIEMEMERCHRRDGGISQELMDSVYEARAAIGEDAP